jgi:hypothetical protein
MDKGYIGGLEPKIDYFGDLREKSLENRITELEEQLKKIRLDYRNLQGKCDRYEEILKVAKMEL